MRLQSFFEFYSWRRRVATAVSLSSVKIRFQWWQSFTPEIKTFTAAQFTSFLDLRRLCRETNQYITWLIEYFTDSVFLKELQQYWFMANELRFTDARDTGIFVKECVCVSVPEVFISARGHSLHIPYFQTLLLLMTHLPCLITGSSTHSPPSDYRITLLLTPYNEMEGSMQKVVRGNKLIVTCFWLFLFIWQRDSGVSRRCIYWTFREMYILPAVKKICSV